VTVEGAGVIVNGAAVPAVPVAVVDPTGAGDSFSAGFLSGLLANGDAVAAAKVGVRVAATAVGRMGARPA